MATTIQDICTDALLEPNILAEGETPSAGMGTIVLKKLRRLLNNWNADRRSVYATAFVTNTLTPNLSPHTIGPTGATWTVTQRPVSVDGASLVLTGVSNPTANLRITLRDSTWWNNQIVPDLATSVPTDLYYQPDWPNGKLFFWPVPTVAYNVQLMLRVLLDDTVVLADAFDLPPGYQDAITLSLSESICRTFGVPLANAAEIRQNAKVARARIFSNNEQPTRIRTVDAGMQSGQDNRPTYNYLIGPFGNQK